MLKNVIDFGKSFSSLTEKEIIETAGSKINFI
jgi:hypothetical protein